MRKWLLVSMMLIAVVVPAMAMKQGEQDFSRYDIILARKPFGANAAPPPVSVSVAPQRVDPAKSFIKDYNMCAIRESLVGVSVGLVNIKAKPARSFFLYEGDSEDGVLLVEADFREEKALLRKGDEECWISMSGAVRSAVSFGGRLNPRGDLSNVQALISSRLKRGRGQRKPFKVMSNEEYKRRRASGDIPPPVPPGRAVSAKDGSSLSAADKRQKLREYNLDLIRSGGKKGLPLPVPLTVEEDAQLVEEGVLPPR